MGGRAGDETATDGERASFEGTSCWRKGGCVLEGECSQGEGAAAWSGLGDEGFEGPRRWKRRWDNMACRGKPRRRRSVDRSDRQSGAKGMCDSQSQRRARGLSSGEGRRSPLALSCAMYAAAMVSCPRSRRRTPFSGRRGRRVIVARQGEARWRGSAWMGERWGVKTMERSPSSGVECQEPGARSQELGARSLVRRGRNV